MTRNPRKCSYLCCPLQRASLLESLSSLALPRSEMALLQPSASIGTSKKTRKQVLREALRQKQLRTGDVSEKHVGGVDVTQGATRGAEDSTLSGTSWRRKKRKQRKLKVEKVMLDPKPPGPPTPPLSASDASGNEGSTTEEEDEKGTLSCVVSTLVGSCLATKVFIGKLIAGYRRGVGDHRIGR